MKRLLCVVGGMNVGGAETFLMKVYRNLDRSKYQMDFAVAIDEKGAYDDEIISLGGKIYHVCPKSKGLIKNFCSVYKIVKANGYKYVLRVSQNSLSALELLAAWMGGASTRVMRSSNTKTIKQGKEAYVHNICKFMPLLFANVRIAPSTEAAEFMFGKNSVKKGKAQILKNGLDFELFKYNQEAREIIRKEYNIPEDAFVVGHVGRFNDQKNHSFLIDVFSEIKRKKQNAVLMMLGDGPLKADIQEKVEGKCLNDSVIFSGVRSDVPSLLSAMDIFVFPSLYEGMPNAVIEAQINGLNCVISDTITRETDITGNVRYASIKNNPELWADLATKEMKTRRELKSFSGINEYSINNVAKKFAAIVFERN